MKPILTVAALALFAWSPTSHAGDSIGGSDGTCSAFVDDVQSQRRELRGSLREVKKAEEEQEQSAWMEDEIAAMEPELEALHLQREELLAQISADGGIAQEQMSLLRDLNDTIHEVEWQLKEYSQIVIWNLEQTLHARELVLEARVRLMEARDELRICQTIGG